MPIANSAMLVELNISVWGASKIDRRATDKTTADAHAAADAGQFRKNLMAGTSLRKEISDYAALCRTWHAGCTLPWSDKGLRLLPTSLFLEYKREMDERQRRFTDMVQRFLNDYPTLQAQAQTHLGNLYNPDDYPSPDEVAQKFGFRVVFSPVPQAGDFRVDVSSDMADALRAQYEDAYQTRVQDAMRTAWDKLHATLRNMSERLSEADGDERKVFRGAFLTNVHELVRLLSHLNVTGDPELERARRGLQQAVDGVDIEDIRQDAGIRADLKARVDKVLSAYDW